MSIDYKELESCSLTNERYKQAQGLDEEEINYSEQPQNFLNPEGIEEYLNPDLFLEFIEIFHAGVSSQNSGAIIESLYQFFSQISYLDKDSNECKIILSDYTLFIDQTPIIVDDIISCLKKQTAIDIHRAVLELIDYISSQSDFFIDLFLQRNGIDQIISLVKVLAEEEILLKSIQLLGEFSSNKRSHQMLVKDDFFRTFITICNTLFNGNRFKKTFNQMIYYCAFLLRQIIGIIVEQLDQKEEPLPQPNDPDFYRIMCYQQQQQQNQIKQHNINNIINPGVYKIIWHFFANKYFFKNPNFPYSQGKAIETFQLLCTEHYFIKNIFPNILHYIPLMVQNNLLILENKIKIYQLITMVYDSAPQIETLIYCIEPIQPNEKLGIPWDLLIESITTENKKEIFAALDVIQALFNYNLNSIGIALKKDLSNILIELAVSGPYKIKIKALQTIYLWMKCNTIDSYSEPFINFEFIENLFQFLEVDDQTLNENTYQVISLIFILNSRFPRLDEESLNQYHERLNEIVDPTIFQ